ncbi:MAG: T9SS type A sorting domain-containing protein [Cytophagales bacterium]|nr:T9SS type A sorting domain-containing protein [Cytophagales bacterium]
MVSLKNLVDGVRNLSISSIDGKYVKKNISQVGLQQSVLDLSGLESGLYLLNIVTNQSQQTIKIILK